MKQEQVEQFRHWFEDYTSRFYSDDEYVNIHIQLKQDHTRHTCEEIAFLAGQLALDESQKYIAEVIALFHDIGRFPQFAKYRTYKDVLSVDHCHLGVEVLTQEGILGCLRREERQWIETAVEHHGRKSLPSDLRGQALLFAKLIRDADKLDIFRQVQEDYQGQGKSPNTRRLEVELPDEPWCSPDVLQALLNEEVLDYWRLRTLSDMRLCQLAWVYDMNFPASLVRLCERRFLEQILNHLPAMPETDRVRDKILGYVAARVHVYP